jgi:hypothetical protein
MVVPVAVPPLIEVQWFMRISLMIGIGAAGTAAHGSTTTSTSFLPRDDGFGPRMEFLSSPGMEMTNGTLKQVDQGLRLYSSSSSGVVSLMARATAPCSGSYTRPWPPRRAAVVVGQALGLFRVLADAA